LACMLIWCGMAWGQQTDIESFEDGVPAHSAATRAGSLGLSPWHSKDGRNSLRWDWARGEALVIRHDIGDPRRAGGYANYSKASFAVWVYMEEPLAGAEIVFFPHQEHCLWNDVPHVEILARARAIENVLYMVPCGPTAAEDGVYGRTGVIDPTGKYVLQLPPKEEAYGSTTVDLGLVDRVSIDGPSHRRVPMREQMLRDAAEQPFRGRRRPEAYSLLTKQKVTGTASGRRE